jgi:hypothetical protein
LRVGLGVTEQSELGDELFEALGRADVGVDFLAGALDGLCDAGLVEGFQYVVDGIDVEGLNGVVVEGGGEDDVRYLELAFDELFEDAEAIEAGHLNVEEDEVRTVFLDEIDGFDAVFALGQEIDFGEGFEEEGEFLASRFFVVDDDGGDGHGRRRSIPRVRRSDEWRAPPASAGIGYDAKRVAQGEDCGEQGCGSGEK